MLYLVLKQLLFPPSRQGPQEASYSHATNAHEQSHDKVDSIVVKESNPTLDLATAAVVPLIMCADGHLEMV